MTFILSSILDILVAVFKHIVVDMFASHCVPERDYVESIHSGHYVTMLLPEQVIISIAACVLQLQPASEGKLQDLLHDSSCMEEPDPLLTNIDDRFTMLGVIDQLVESQATLVEQIYIELNQVVKLIQSENNALFHHTLVHLCNTQINEVIVELELQFVVEKYE